MNKFYSILSLVFVLSSATLHAQDYFSFEASEGYVLGNIDGQQGWTTTGLGSGQYTELQVITDQLSKTGDRSLKISYEPSASSQPFPVMGAFRNIDTPLDRTNFSITYSANIENAPGGNSSIFALECGSRADQKLVLEIYFSYDGKILVLENADVEFIVTQIGTWQEDIWYDISISGTPNGIEYSLDGELKYTGALLYDIDELRFAHDNFSGSAYFDDISVEHTTLQVTDVHVDSFKIYPNPVQNILSLQGVATLESYIIFDMTGKQLKEANTNINQIDVSNLSNGVYWLQLNTQNGPVSKKFIKK